MITQEYMSRIEFLLQVFELNDETRTGWERRGIENSQRVAGHAWGVVLLTMLFAEKCEGVDPDRALKMAIVHDIPESKVGDIAIGEVHQDISISEKVEQEEEAMNELVNMAGEDVPQVKDIQTLWLEFEKGDTVESRFVRDMDIIDMCLMALKYEREGRYDESMSPEGEYEHLDGFFATARNEISSNAGEQLLQEIESKYEEAKDKPTT